MQSKKFSLIGISDQVLGTVSLEHLWANVYGIKLIKAEEFATADQWLEGIANALQECAQLNTSQVFFRLIKDQHSDELSRLLPSLGFTKKSGRLEFKAQVSSLPENIGSPLLWKTAEQLKWSKIEIVKIINLVSHGDPGHDPSEDPSAFVQDFLSGVVLTSGLDCVHIGFLNDEVTAFTVVQMNPKSGWSRISYMGIAPSFRKRGLGVWVHRYSFSIMKKIGGKNYHGGTDINNTAMIKLFELNGCEKFCEMEEWVINYK